MVAPLSLKPKSHEARKCLTLRGVKWFERGVKLPVRFRRLLIRSQFVMDRISMDRMERINGSFPISIVRCENPSNLMRKL